MNSITERQRTQQWGDAVVDRLAEDIQRSFPGIEGFSPRNIWRMRAFYMAYTVGVKILPQPVAELDGKSLPQAVAEIPWDHNMVILEKIKNPLERIWYAKAALEHGWSRSILVHHIEAELHKRQAKAITNFSRTLPPPQSSRFQHKFEANGIYKLSKTVKLRIA